ncbi:ketosteroid isomerase-like protein [Catenulispora sp. GP43]|uniref:nuclear transport factor 2 family protein n=1 Tax=Catenulispora sp. GP43 TaxID=3156263 RepID=UPI003519226A
MTAETADIEALVRRAHHTVEGDVLDVQGFMDLFTEDGVFTGIGGSEGQTSYRGEQLRFVVAWMGRIIQPTGARVDIPAADFWYARDGKIETFNCHIGMMRMVAQMGVEPDHASAVAASATGV